MGGDVILAGKLTVIADTVERTKGGTMDIRRAIPTDREVLLDIWLRSVRATHTFLSEEDIQVFLPLTRDYLGSNDAELWVLCSDEGAIMGFMGNVREQDGVIVRGPRVSSPRRRQLIGYAQELRGELTVDVNEQNLPAWRFYEACGFVTERRSELDSTGRPFPFLHMRFGRTSFAARSGSEPPSDIGRIHRRST